MINHYLFTIFYTFQIKNLVYKLIWYANQTKRSVSHTGVSALIEWYGLQWTLFRCVTAISFFCTEPNKSETPHKNPAHHCCSRCNSILYARLLFTYTHYTLYSLWHRNQTTAVASASTVRIIFKWFRTLSLLLLL